MMRFLKVDVGRKTQRSFFQGPAFGWLFVISRDYVQPKRFLTHQGRTQPGGCGQQVPAPVSGRGRRRRARAGAGSCPPPRGRGDPGQRPRSVNPVSTAHLQSGRATLLRAAVCTSNPCADARRWGLQGETEKGPCAGAGRSLEQGAERQQRRPVCGGAGRGTRWHSPSSTGAEMSPRLVQTVGPEAAGAWAGGHLPSRFGIGRT